MMEEPKVLAFLLCAEVIESPPGSAHTLRQLVAAIDCAAVPVVLPSLCVFVSCTNMRAGPNEFLVRITDEDDQDCAEPNRLTLNPSGAVDICESYGRNDEIEFADYGRYLFQLVWNGGTLISRPFDVRPKSGSAGTHKN
jgi:hypothetical protein